MAAKRARTTSQTKEEVGFRPEHTRAGGGQRRAAETVQTAGGGTRYVAPTIPDPGITHGRFKVLQRTDGPFIVVDTEAPIGARTVEVFETKTKQRPKGHEDPKKAAELHAIALAKTEDPPNGLHEKRPAPDLPTPVEPAPPGS